VASILTPFGFCTLYTVYPRQLAFIFSLLLSLALVSVCTPTKWLLYSPLYFHSLWLLYSILCILPLIDNRSFSFYSLPLIATRFDFYTLYTVYSGQVASILSLWLLYSIYDIYSRQFASIFSILLSPPLASTLYIPYTPANWLLYFPFYCHFLWLLYVILPPSGFLYSPFYCHSL